MAQRDKRVDIKVNQIEVDWRISFNEFSTTAKSSVINQYIDALAV